VQPSQWVDVKIFWSVRRAWVEVGFDPVTPTLRDKAAKDGAPGTAKRSPVEVVRWEEPTSGDEAARYGAPDFVVGVDFVVVVGFVMGLVSLL
jgi:hypothetical protein